MMSLNSQDHCQEEKQENGTSISIYTSKLSPGADICVGLAILFMVVLSLLGNGVVLVISYWRRRKMASLELLCVNLAVGDFLCCLCFYPLSISSSFSHAWLGQGLTCVYYGLGCYVFGLCSMCTIAAISVIRYMKTCCQLVYDGANIRRLCTAMWAVPALWCSFPLFGWGEYMPEPYGLSCTVAWRGYHASYKDALYVICSFACFTLVPVLVIVVSQCCILHKLCRFSGSLPVSAVRDNLRRTEKRLSMMFFCISLGFVFAWAPYAVVSLLFIFHKGNCSMAPEGFVLPALFAKSSHVYNPFIYFYFNRTYQRELRRLLRSLCPGLMGKRVGVLRPASDPQAPPPIHIHLQLQERAGPRRDGPGPSREEQRGGGDAKPPGGACPHAGAIYPRSGSRLGVSPSRASTVDHRHVREFLPTPTWP